MSKAQTIGNESGATRDFATFRQGILVILAEESMYGLAIRRHLESYCDTEVNHGCPYPNLDDLVRVDLVERSELDKRTNQCKLTDDGLQAVLDRFDWVLTGFVTDDKRAKMVSELVENKL